MDQLSTLSARAGVLARHGHRSPEPQRRRAARSGGGVGAGSAASAPSRGEGGESPGGRGPLGVRLRVSLPLLPLLVACPAPKPVTDPDGDGYVEDDCAEGDATVHPGALDEAGDGLDADCDGLDGTDADADGVLAGDGPGLDCDDADPSRPGEEVYNDLDDDCDGCVDDLLWGIGGFNREGTEFLTLGWTTDGMSQREEVRVGIAETGAGPEGWYGEDCSTKEQCHRLGAISSGLGLEVEADTADVELGVSTWFDRQTAVLATQVFVTPNGACTVYGADPSYYDGTGCCVPNDWAPWP